MTKILGNAIILIIGVICIAAFIGCIYCCACISSEVDEKTDDKMQLKFLDEMKKKLENPESD